MKRKLTGAVLFLCALICVMGADSISYNAGQPNPNPGGKAGTIEANGTYTLDPGHTYGGSRFEAEQGGIISSYPAKGGAGQTWATGVEALPAGTYNCTAKLTVDDGQKLWLVDSPTVQKTVK